MAMPMNSWLSEGERLYTRGDFAQAHLQLEEAAIQEQSDPHVHWLMGHVLRGEQRHEEAIHAYQCALALDGNCAEAHLGMAQSLTALQRFTDAIVAGHRAVAAAPGSADAQYALATALDTAEQKEQA